MDQREIMEITECFKLNEICKHTHIYMDMHISKPRGGVELHTL